MPSIHELEEGLKLTALPPVDLDPRALGVERVLPPGLDAAAYEAADYEPVRSWAGEAFAASVSEAEGRITVTLACGGVAALEKTYVFDAQGGVTVTYRWDPSDLPPGAFFAPEISVSSDPGLVFEPEPDDVWRYDIVTVSKKESGYEETVQGVSITPRWACRLGMATVRFPSPR